MDLIKLYFKGTTLVFLVSLNISNVANYRFVSAFFVGVLISIVWGYIVTDISMGGFREILAYALGAGTGTETSMLFSWYVYG